MIYIPLVVLPRGAGAGGRCGRGVEVEGRSCFAEKRVGCFERQRMELEGRRIMLLCPLPKLKFRQALPLSTLICVVVQYAVASDLSLARIS